MKCNPIIVCEKIITIQLANHKNTEQLQKFISNYMVTV